MVINSILNNLQLSYLMNLNNKHLHIFWNQLNFQLEYIKNVFYNINKIFTLPNIINNKHFQKYL